MNDSWNKPKKCRVTKKLTLSLKWSPNRQKYYKLFSKDRCHRQEVLPVVIYTFMLKFVFKIKSRNTGAL